LSHCVQVAGATWHAATRIVTGVGDLVQRTGDDRTDRMMLCAVYTVHMETMSADFLIELQNQGRWFGLKTGGDGFLWFGLKIGGDGFLRFGLKTGSYGLMIWASKLAATVW
jgi:hypothetical protein